MTGKLRAVLWRPSASVAIMLATLSGCATQTATLRDTHPTNPAPDLLNVSTVAPPINAVRVAGVDGTPQPRSGGRSTTEAPGLRSTANPCHPTPDPHMIASTDKAVATVSGLPPLPQPPVRSGPNDLARPDVNLNAGLMGPTPPVAALAASTPPTIPQSAAPYPIDLSAALRLADGQNPVIGEARVLILGALAERQAARALLLPYLNVGTNYHDHTGPLQRSNGQILKLTEQSLYVGGGSGAFAAGTVDVPAVNIFSPLTDAVFAPLAAQQRVIGARYNASDTSNKVLLDVASLYIDLIGAEAILEARRVTAAESDRIAASVAAFAATGQGRRSDSERAEADRRLFQADIQKAEERVAVASARLAERLNLDPSAQLRPIAGPLEPIELINPETPPDELIRSAVSRRPDLAAREALVNQAEFRVWQEKARPFLPTIWLGFSGGAFGGGSNLTATPLGSFAGRTDFDVQAYWTVLNLGAGNASRIKRRKAEAGQAMADRSRIINQVRAEVASARAESLALRAQVTNARFGLRTAEEGYRLDQERLPETLSLPIEALDSLRLLSDARVALIQAITRANRTQFALFVSLGAPPPLDAK
jgi:outer membrane protein TolC